MTEFALSLFGAVSPLGVFVCCAPVLTLSLSLGVCLAAFPNSLNFCSSLDFVLKIVLDTSDEELIKFKGTKLDGVLT